MSMEIEKVVAYKSLDGKLYAVRDEAVLKNIDHLVKLGVYECLVNIIEDDRKRAKEIARWILELE